MPLKGRTVALRLFGFPFQYHAAVVSCGALSRYKRLVFVQFTDEVTQLELQSLVFGIESDRSLVLSHFAIAV